MTVPPSPSGVRPNDRVLSLLAAGQHDQALRHALPLVEAHAGAPLAWFVVGHSLAALGESALGTRTLRFAARLAISASRLPLAVACAAALRDLKEDAAPVIEEIAAAFGRGSPRLGERRAAPPVLSGGVAEIEPLSDSIELEALVIEAGQQLERVEAAEASKAPQPLSAQPLFSALLPAELSALVSIFQVRLLPTGTRIVEEGALGLEAFIVARGELDVAKRTHRSGATSVHLARLGAGALVGEMALLSRAPRAATVTSVCPCIVLVGHKEALDRVVVGAPEVGRKFAEHCKRRMLDNLVRTSTLFRAATPAERPALVERFRIKTFEPGEPLATQGQPSEGLYVLASGEVSIVHRDAAETTIVTRLGPGDVVGEVALVLRRPAIADAVAQHPTVTLFLARDRFMELVRAHPKVFADLYELAAQRDQEILSMSEQEATEGEDFVLV